MICRGGKHIDRFIFGLYFKVYVKISKVLMDSQKTRKQSHYRLAYKNPETGKIESYCALGALGCEKKIVTEKTNIYRMDYNNILKAYGILNPRDIWIIMPKGNEMCEYQSLNLSTAIYQLNDAYKWSFEKIGKWIKKLEDKGVIKYKT